MSEEQRVWNLEKAGLWETAIILHYGLVDMESLYGMRE